MAYNDSRSRQDRFYRRVPDNSGRTHHVPVYGEAAHGHDLPAGGVYMGDGSGWSTLNGRGNVAGNAIVGQGRPVRNGNPTVHTN